MEPTLEEARVAGNILEMIVLSLLLFGWSFYVRQHTKIMRRAEDVRRSSDRL